MIHAVKRFVTPVILDRSPTICTQKKNPQPSSRLSFRYSTTSSRRLAVPSATNNRPIDVCGITFYLTETSTQVLAQLRICLLSLALDSVLANPRIGRLPFQKLQSTQNVNLSLKSHAIQVVTVPTIGIS